METITEINVTPRISFPYNVNSDHIINSFINSLDIKESSKKLYYRTLKLFFKWVNQKNYLLDHLTRAELLEYKTELLLSQKSSLTATSYITSLRVFYEWTEANKIYPNICKGIKSPKRKQQFKKRPLTPEQATALLLYYQKTDLRNYAIINLLLRTGLRTIELVRANIEDIVTKGDQRVLLVQGKGRDEKDDFVLLTDKTHLPILEYLATREVTPGSPLFISTSNNNRNQRLTTRTISKIVKDALRGLGINQSSYTAHSLRHTGATMILKATGDLEKTRLFCRHSNPATTLIYTATLTEERKLQNSGEVLLDTIF